jgi:hypothetical protein
MKKRPATRNFARSLLIAMTAIGAIGNRVIGAATAAERRWSIAVCGPVSDPRRTAVDEAVAFWNEQLGKLRANLSLGPIATCDRSVPDETLVRISDAILRGERAERLPREVESVDGDIIIVLSGADLVSVGGAGGRHGLTILRRADIPPLSLPNVARNVVAHELGHVLGLSHNADPTLLMCGRPAPCRPALFRSDAVKFFPLTEAETRELAKRYR